MRLTTLALSLSLLSTSAAFAQAPAGPPAVAAPAPTPLAAPAPTGDEGRRSDPNIDRGFLLPTAETQPAGTVTFTDYYLVLGALTWGITDRLQVTAGSLLIAGGPTRLAMGNLKLQVLRHGRFRVSLMAGAAYVDSTDFLNWSEKDDGVRQVAPFGGAVGSVCLDRACHSLFSTNVHLLRWRGLVKGPLHDDAPKLSLMYSAGVVARLHSHFKLLAELTSGHQFQTDARPGGPGVLIGMRFVHPRVALEGGMLANGLVEADMVPFLSASVRIGGR